MIFIDNDNNITLTRGDTSQIDITILDQEGEPYTLRAGEQLVLTVKKNYLTDEVLIEKILTEPSFSFLTNDTKDLSFGIYKYDIYLTDGESIDTFIYQKNLVIAEEVHEFE